jgi:hypothetical protein
LNVSTGEVTYVTIADERFFVGAVAMVNSLRLTGHHERIVVLDAGLTAEQRAVLGRECDLLQPPVTSEGVFVVFLKTVMHLLELRGTVILIDSDVVVTRHLGPIVEAAQAGRIVLVADQFPERHFPEWQEILGLDRPPRRDPHLGAGFIALDLDQWPDFMPRWLELCRRVPQDRADLPFDLPRDVVRANPFAFPEQDVMNALLASEVDRDRIEVFSLDVFPGPPHNDGIQIVDRKTLRCRHGEHEPYLLHYWNHPKVWLPDARATLSMDAYVELTARLLTAPDVPLRLPAADLPVWLHDDLRGRLVRRTPRRIRRTIRALLRALPDPFEQRARDVGGVVAARLRLG